MASLDTNCILRYLLQDIPEQAKIVENLMRVSRRLDVDDLALAEIAFVMEKKYMLPREMIADSFEQLMMTGVIYCSREVLSVVLPLWMKHPKLSFIDCCLAVKAEQNETAPLLTFDRKLAAQLSQATLLFA